MAAGGDPEAIRAHARRLRSMAEDVGRTGDRVRSGAGIEWVGVAADRYRERLAEHGQRVTAAQDEMTGTAAQLDHLADELEARKVGWEPLPPKYTTGVLAKYRKLVGSASEGAVTG